MRSMQLIFFVQLISSIVLITQSMYVIHDINEEKIGFENVDGITTLGDTPQTKRVKKSVAIQDKKQLWNSGIIPYEIENTFTGSQRRAIKLAMRMWEESTCIKFVERDSSIQDFIVITRLNCGCCYMENMIRNKERSELSLDDGCEEIPIVLHELGHVVGFYHEHQHPDRDEYIKINEHNIERGFRRAFGKYSSDQVDTLGQPYDYRSIMHYDKNAFARHEFMETIVPLQLDNGTVPVIGNEDRLSASDIAATNRLYKCPKCGGFLTHSSGSIELPNNTNGHCEWRIRAAYGERIVFRIESLNIQATADCTSEYFEIQNGLDTLRSPILGRYCGQMYGSGTIATESMTLSYFKTDKSSTSSELKATYQKICDGLIFVLNNSTVYLESPNYPKNYEPNKDCLWYLRAPEDHIIEIQFNFFSLEASQDCANDYVKINDGYRRDSSIIGTYCGAKNPWTVTSPENSIYIKFISNEYNEDAGFSASITAVPDK